jgi:hypothetical protein
VPSLYGTGHCEAATETEYYVLLLIAAN